jgi:hypothetical protein
VAGATAGDHSSDGFNELWREAKRSLRHLPPRDESALPHEHAEL